MRRHGKFPAFEHLVPDRASWSEGYWNDYRRVESQVLRAGRTWGIVADAHPDARSSKTLVGGPVFERVEQALGHRFIWTDMANERQMRPQALLRLRAHPGAVAAGRHAEAATKGASKCFMILETAIEGDVEQRLVMDQQPELALP